MGGDTLAARATAGLRTTSSAYENRGSALAPGAGPQPSFPGCKGNGIRRGKYYMWIASMDIRLPTERTPPRNSWGLSSRTLPLNVTF